MISNDNVRRILIDSGWHEGRVINTDEMVKVLVNDGYSVFPNALSFLKEFGLLEIKYILPKDESYTIKIEVGTKKARIFKSVVGAYESYHNTRMLPVAVIRGLGMTVCISEEGKFYGGYDEELVTLGDNFEMALINLTTNTNMEKVYVDLED